LRGYNVLDVTDFHHFCINHFKRIADHHNHINGIVNFRNPTKRHMRRFIDIPQAQFGLYLTKCEWRLNNREPSSQSCSQNNGWTSLELGI